MTDQFVCILKLALSLLLFQSFVAQPAKFQAQKRSFFCVDYAFTPLPLLMHASHVHFGQQEHVPLPLKVSAHDVARKIQLT